MEHGGVTNRVDDAVEFFARGYSCAQAVLLAYAPSVGIESGQAMRVAAGFAAGMRLGGTCGAVTGGVMVLGLSMCHDGCAAREERARLADPVSDFSAEFARRLGALDCPAVLGCDLRTDEGWAQAEEQQLFRTVCLRAVREAATILDGMVPRA